MKMKIILALTTASLLSACSSTYHRGIVAMKIDERTAHVGINKTEVSVGDHVELYANKCFKAPKDSNRTCNKVEKGHGQVVEILGENYVTVKFDEGVSFQEGDFIEKHNH